MFCRHILLHEDMLWKPDSNFNVHALVEKFPASDEDVANELELVDYNADVL